MKSAIYLPDALYEVAQALHPEDGLSALCQRGLRALIREESDRPESSEAIAALSAEKRADLLRSVGLGDEVRP